MVYLIKIWLSDSFIANNDAIVYLDAATDPFSLQPAQLVLESGGSDYLNECDWGG
jgi:hypothetical protein